MAVLVNKTNPLVGLVDSNGYRFNTGTLDSITYPKWQDPLNLCLVNKLITGATYSEDGNVYWGSGIRGPGPDKESLDRVGKWFTLIYLNNKVDPYNVDERDRVRVWVGKLTGKEWLSKIERRRWQCVSAIATYNKESEERLKEVEEACPFRYYSSLHENEMVCYLDPRTKEIVATEANDNSNYMVPDCDSGTYKDSHGLFLEQMSKRKQELAYRLHMFQIVMNSIVINSYKQYADNVIKLTLNGRTYLYDLVAGTVVTPERIVSF